MNYTRDPELLERLAAEYVLGTLRGPARLRFARLAREQPAAQAAVRAWENRLAPLGEAVPAAAPRPRLWREVRARIAQQRPAQGEAQGFWDSLALWRNLGLVSSGLAAALIAALALQKPQLVQVPVEKFVEERSPAAQAWYVATIKDREGNVVLLARAARDSDELWFRKTGMTGIPADRVLELWGMPGEERGRMQSLGMLPAQDTGTIRLAGIADRVLADFPTIAVTVEPAGGSKTGAPTGPMLYSGPCFKFW